MRYFILIIFMIISLGVLAQEGMSKKIEGVGEGYCEAVFWKRIPVLICSRPNELLIELESKKNSQFSDSENRNILHAIQRIAELFGSDVASILLPGNLSINSRFTQSSIAFIAIDRNGCTLKYLPEKKLLTSPCSKRVYDLSGRILSKGGFYGDWNLVLVPLDLVVEKTVTEFEPEFYDFFPALYADKVTEKEKVKLFLNWGRVGKLRSHIGRHNVNDILDENNNAAIHLALVGNEDNSIQVVQYLIGLGADLNKSNGLGSSPLFLALLKGNIKIIRLLVSSGANVCQIVENPESMYLLQSTDDKDIEYLLREEGSRSCGNPPEK